MRYLKTIGKLILLGMFPLLSVAQEITWNTAPRKGFVFQINNKEAQKLLTQYTPDTIFHGLLHTQIDTFDVKKGWINRPAKGHFLLASVVENKLRCEYTSVFPYQVFLLKEYDALALQVLDLEGNVRDDAIVRLKQRKIRMDPESKIYRLANEWFTGDNRMVTVELEGFRSVFNVEKHDVPTWYDQFDYSDGPSFYSYMITDKNKYKPNEKVRYKSYALSRYRSPLRKTLEVWLGYGSDTKKITTIEPHRPGSYAGEFTLHDSLRLSLDRNYHLQLREKNGRYVSNSTFRYEDYELDGNKLEIRLATRKQFHPAKNELTILATDANGLMLKDAKASITIKAVDIRETFQPLVILRDTVMFMEMNLDPGEPTVVDIPSQFFEKTNTRYEVSVRIRNSQNQAIEQTAAASHYYSSYELVARFSNDSIVYEMLQNGVTVNHVPFTLRHNGEVNARTVHLPFKEKINPVLSTVYLQGDSIFRDIALNGLIPTLELKGGIAKDSFNIRLNNPQKLDVSWFVYQGAELMKKGFGKELELDTAIIDRTQTYYVELLYSFGGEEHIKRKEFQFRDDILNVSLDVPERVYPGQVADATIQVTDKLGLPVSGADLTALGVTGKLNYYLEDLPYYGTSSTPRSTKAHFSKRDINKRTAQLSLDYKKWEKRAGMDTMKYYQFTYPGSAMFTHSVTIDDSTQFAPYVMQNGMARQVHVIELNRKPVYYSWVDQPRQYSFYVPASGKVSITLRLYDRVLLFDSLSFRRGQKTILSIDLDNLPANVKTYKFGTPPRRNKRKVVLHELTKFEIDRHKSYLASFRYVDGNAYLEYGTEFTPLFKAQEYLRKDHITVGPITPGLQTFYSPRNALTSKYQHEGGYTYTFDGNVVYKLNAWNLVPTHLNNYAFQPMTSVNDKVMTKRVFLEPSYIPGKYHTRSVNLIDHAIQMQVLLPEEKAASGFATILFRHCTSKEIISPCKNKTNPGSEFYNIPRGCYTVIALYNNGTHLKIDSVTIRSYSKVVIDLNKATLIPADSISHQWLMKASDDCYGPMQRRVITMRRSMAGIAGNIKGVVYAQEDGSPLPGVNVLVKGTTNGTVTDADGQFALHSDDPYVTLQVSFIGFSTVEIGAHVNSIVDVFMVADVMQLTEVIVTGQGYARESHTLGYSVRMLNGRIPGVTIDSSGADEEEIAEDRGTEAEKQEGEKRLYHELLNLNTIRSHFRDVAFWEPKLFTDKKGQSAFTITFPDDITRWEATVYAMNRQLQTGTGRKIIRSYKPIMAELLMPQFLTQGDSAFFLGRVLNYTQDGTIAGKVQWNGSASAFEKDVQFTEFHLDKLPVVATTTDSITSRYLFTRNDGYLDGEERKVPVVEQGIIRADGTLSVLKNKEALQVKASSKETVTVEFLASPIDVLAGEARYLMSYFYDCNEQLASKLIGLINYRLVMQYEGKPFRFNKEVNKIIARLLKNQNREFLWSWWDVSPNTSYWMSAHILRALKKASDAGYNVDLNIENLARKMEYKFDILKHYSLEDVDLLNVLSSWNARLDYAKYLTKLDAVVIQYWKEQATNKRRGYRPYSLLEETLLLQEVRLHRNLSYQRDTLLRYQKQGILGDTYFADGKIPRSWHQDELAVNVIAYRIVKHDTVLNRLVGPMQTYFLSERSKGSWNTYRSSNVIMAVLSDLVADGASKNHVALIHVSGKVDTTIEKFPHRLELLSGEEITIRKESGVPVYFMQYTKERVTKAKTGVEGFEIKTSIGNNRWLEAGKPVSLTVEVDVKKEANQEYVMIEIPIPGSCSYANKSVKRDGIETHREYFKDRTVIFCQNMKSGKYTFEVELLPRFTGKYIINPAQVSLMYIPVVNANTDLKKVRVE